jgi:DNA-binding transcriptional regulator YbjK
MATVCRSREDLVAFRSNPAEHCSRVLTGYGDPMPAASVRRDQVPRRELLIEAALGVIAEQGVAGTTHRRVAAAAGVPLGSTTYYFADLHDLLGAAFGRFADQISERFEARLAPARSAEEAITAITDFLLFDFDDPRDLALSYEFYAYAIRRPVIGDMVEAWFRRSQQALGRFFDPVTARLVDTFIEGLFTYRGLAREFSDAAEIRRGLEVLSGGGGRE